MKFFMTTLFILLYVCKLTSVAAPDPVNQSNSKASIASWQGPSGQNNVEAYIRSIQNFWTDDRTARAGPNPMPSDVKSTVPPNANKK